MSFNLEIGGRFCLQVEKPDGKVVKRTPWFHNVLTDDGLFMLGDTRRCVERCKVGTGTSTPSTSDIGLENPIATSDEFSVASDTSPTEPGYEYAARVFEYEFSAGLAEGNLTEIGIFDRVSSGKCFSRELIRDSAGNSTSITILSDEILRVFYEFRMYVPQGNFNGTVDVSGTSHNWTARAAGAGSWNLTGPGGGTPGQIALFGESFAGVIGNTQNPVRLYDGEISADISGTPSGSSTFTGTTSEVKTNPLRAEHAFSVDIDTANFETGIKSIAIDMGPGAFQFEFDPAIPKDETQTFSMAFEITWSRGPTEY